MTTTKNRTKKPKDITNFSPSVNIIRDADLSLNYIPTPNARQVYDQLINDYCIGIRSFSIVGAYGTGKSSFLLAFERHINQKQKYFSQLNKAFRDLKGFKFMPIVGSFNSLIDDLAVKFKIVSKQYTTKNILRQIDKQYKALEKSGKGMVLVVDEFGKYLEYAAKNNPESELYFIQQLAEYTNDPSKNIIFITILHQDFNGYSRDLSKAQQNEWDKIKGRLRELTFNEPVEQLLFLAAERISQLRIGVKSLTHFPNLFKAIEQSRAFPLKDYFKESLAKNLLPFDILASSVLTLALQKYGQNERSLFSFIESNGQFGIKGFDEKQPYYNLSRVYDYLIHNYYSFLTTKYNPHYTQWAAIRTAIERAEGVIEEGIHDTICIIKAIGLLNIFASASAHIDKTFLSDYAKYAMGIKNPKNIIDLLEGFKIIRFVKYSDKYILFEGTDLDIELAIDKAGNLIERVNNVVHHLNKYFDLQYLPAKAAYYDKGTPRFFAFKISELPEKNLYPENEIDGYINLVFSDGIKEKDVKEASNSCEEAVLFGWYKNNNEIRNLLFEIEKVQKVRENHLDDRVAVRELENILQHQIKLLNHYVLGNIYSEDSPVVWYFKGVKQKIKDIKTFNRLLSSICNEVYPSTPIFKNEMVNKTKVSGVIGTARKNLVRAITENWSEKDLGLDENKFPPEKTIYLSLLRETGIHHKTKDGYTLGRPDRNNILLCALWEMCESFLNQTKQEGRNLKELVNLLLSRPIKLKRGFIDFWIPVFLFAKRDDFALFGKDGYIPQLSDETLDLVVRDPEDYKIKAFDIEGVKLDLFNRYRSLLNQEKRHKPGNTSFIETIRPFLTFYRQLPEYAKNTRRLNKEALALREAIASAKDPEESFFEIFPGALGFSFTELKKKGGLEKYVRLLEDSIREIRTCCNELYARLEVFILEEIIGEQTRFPEYKLILQKRFAHIKQHLLLPHQRVFYQRIMSELDDRKSWLDSLTQAVLSKSLDRISDKDEPILYEKLKDTIHELDNLCEISNSGFDERREIAFKLEVTSFVEGLQSNLVRLPKSKNKQFIQLQGIVKAKLSKDKQLNIAALTKILEDLLLTDEK